MTIYVNKDKLPENCLKYVEFFIKSIKGKKDITSSYDMKQLIITLSNSETNDFWKILLEGYFEELRKNNICLENLFYELSEISNETNFKKLAEDNIIFKEFILMFYEILLNEEYTNIIKNAFNLFKLLFDNNVRFFFENGKLKIIGMNSCKLIKLIIED